MATLSREHRRLLENTVVQAREIAVEGARKVLADQYAVHHHEPWPHMIPENRALRNELRAHGRQLGDKRDAARETQEIEHLAQACAYDHWHRMLFARFLAENDFLLDADHGIPMTLDEVRELAREQNRDWLDLAAELAQRMLLAVFRPDDPVLKVPLPLETRQQLEEKLTKLPAEIFRADDSLGWVYQFWQRDEKERINKSEVKIGADQLPAVTQLFTEDYMVLFLLENTLGAWWVAKRRSQGKNTELPGYAWTYLRVNDDGSPAAGGFEGWPRAARDLRVLDPCMGSGHFLVSGLPILTRMRMEEEALPLQEALFAVLKDNLFGLEIDPRCAQIAAFNVALAAWRLAGAHFSLPQMNLACSGLGINASEADWVLIAGGDFAAHQWMSRLYALFKDAPTLGSLIDPSRFLEQGQEAGFERIVPLVENALRREKSGEIHELAVAAQGLLTAFQILAGRFTLVVTNVPYLGRGRQEPIFAEYCATFHSDAKADLATCFVDRCLRFCGESGSIGLVTKQETLYLTDFKELRPRLLKNEQWDFVIKLGSRAFQTISGEVVNVALLGLTHRRPATGHEFLGIDASGEKKPETKALALLHASVEQTSQSNQLSNPDAIIVIGADLGPSFLHTYANAWQGIATSDLPRFGRVFWEFSIINGGWVFQQSVPQYTDHFMGRENVLFWEDGHGQITEVCQKGATFRGQSAWGQMGVVVGQMSTLPVCLYTGEHFSNTVAVLIPYDAANLLPIWEFCRSPEFARLLRRVNPKLNVDNGYISKIPFDLSHWQRVAAESYSVGLPTPHSDDPTQWLFAGHPKHTDRPLQVAVARLVGYRWPRQTGSSFPACPMIESDGLETHEDADGIVCLNSLAGEPPASDRLRSLLADAYGAEWSAAKLKELLGKYATLEEWLRDRFFEEHCSVFHQLPFVWHIWDGRKDGFHALVNYHRLVATDGEGRKTLEKLIYTMLGDWIQRQRDEVKIGKEAADARLAAALHLQSELGKILSGEKPYDIFVRWKPLHEQPIGWESDVNVGVRPNIRPWLVAKPYQPSRRDACILRVTPRILYGKDRGKEPYRPKQDFPWFWNWDEASEDFAGGNEFDGARWNDLHYSLNAKKQARENKHESEADLTQAKESKV
jgi:hypothetical protein